MADITSLAMELELTPGNWTDKAADVLINKTIVIDYGIRGLRPTNRLAQPGKMTFYLNNSSGNSGGLEGYYSPGHANALSGFVVGTKCRLHIVFSAIDYYKGYGKIGKIHPKEGTKGERWVKVTVNDWLYDAQKHKVKLLEAQENQRSDTFAATIIANMTEQPRATSYGTGQETFPYVGDDLTEGKTSAYTLLQRTVMSEWGYAMVIGDQVGGGTFLFQNRHARYKDRTLQATITGGDVFSIKAEYDPGLIFNIINTKIYPRDVGTSVETLADLDSPIELVIGATETINLNYRDPDSQDVSLSGKDIQDPEGNNQVVNRGFETDVSGWEEGASPADGTETIERSGTQKKVGSYSMLLTTGTVNPSNYYTESDSIEGVTQGDVLYVNAWVYVPSAWPNGEIEFWGTEYNGEDVFQTNVLIESSVTTGGWVRLSGTYTIQDADTEKLTLAIGNLTAGDFSGGAVTVYVDEVYAIHDHELNYEFSANDEGGGDMNNDVVFIGSDLAGSGAEFIIENTGAVHGFLTMLRVKGIAIRTYNPVTLPIEDSTSKTDHGDRPIALNLHYQTSRVTGEVFGNDALGDYKDPVRWVKAFTFKANRNSTLLAAALSVEPGKRVKFTESVTAVDTEFFVNGVRLRIYNKSLIDCTWFVTPAKTQAYWELETVGKSEMETYTWLAP